jgi:hypothetical protein
VAVLAHDLVARVALDRCEARVPDQVEQVVAVHRVGRAVVVGIVRDLVLDHRAVEVVGAEVERQLRHRQAVHDPEALDVVEVVEQQPGHGEGLERLGRRGHRRLRLDAVADDAVGAVVESRAGSAAG